MILRIITAPVIGFFITLVVTAAFGEYVKEWEVRNAFPIFIAATAAYIVGGIRFGIKET